ncbi:MAG: hypothetical protein IPG90_17985 [Bacteroidetes bacterium]|nr:hypothetical protein [Bacteroidota bacterium]
MNVQASSNNLCEGDTVILSASGGGTYSWSPAASLSTNSGNNILAFLYPLQLTR